MELWTGIVEWNCGMELWTGIMEWEGNYGVSE